MGFNTSTIGMPIRCFSTCPHLILYNAVANIQNPRTPFLFYKYFRWTSERLPDIPRLAAVVLSVLALPLPLPPPLPENHRGQSRNYIFCRVSVSYLGKGMENIIGLKTWLMSLIFPLYFKYLLPEKIE